MLLHHCDKRSSCKGRHCAGRHCEVNTSKTNTSQCARCKLVPTLQMLTADHSSLLLPHAHCSFSCADAAAESNMSSYPDSLQTSCLRHSVPQNAYPVCIHYYLALHHNILHPTPNSSFEVQLLLLLLHHRKLLTSPLPACCVSPQSAQGS